MHCVCNYRKWRWSVLIFPNVKWNGRDIGRNCLPIESVVSLSILIIVNVASSPITQDYHFYYRTISSAQIWKPWQFPDNRCQSIVFNCWKLNWEPPFNSLFLENNPHLFLSFSLFFKSLSRKNLLQKFQNFCHFWGWFLQISNKY